MKSIKQIFLIQKPKLMKVYSFKVRPELRPEYSHDDILAEFQRWKEAR